MDTQDLLKKYPILRYFSYEHLREPMRSISEQFHVIAWSSARNSPYNPETSSGLRKLLEAKDCIVRANLPTESK